MIITNLNDDELKEYSVFVSRTVIPQLMRFADKYNIDRDSMVKYFSNTMDAFVRYATFHNWKEDQ